MIPLLTQIFKKNYFPLNVIEISKQNLIYNYKLLLSLNKDIVITPVLKSNAYGHGIIQVAKILDSQSPPFFCVDSIYEAYQLLKAKIKSPILIMGYIEPENLAVKKLPFSYSVFNLETLHAIAKYQPQAPIHLFVDTGMHREGIGIDELNKFCLQIKKYPQLEIEGLISHLGDGANINNKLTSQQFKNFKYAQTILKRFNIFPKWMHINASSALLNQYKKQFSIGNISRAGLTLYGIDPSQKDIDQLKPVLELKTKIIQIKKLKKGESLGYDFTFIAPRNIQYAILPIGYNDGVDRRLSNKGIMLINGKPCPVIGRVSMNITTIDITNIKRPYLGQEVLIYSNKIKHKNSIENSANICNTIPYELLVHLNVSIRRRIV